MRSVDQTSLTSASYSWKAMIAAKLPIHTTEYLSAQTSYSRFSPLDGSQRPGARRRWIESSATRIAAIAAKM